MGIRWQIVTVHERLIAPRRSPKANVKSLFYFCFSSCGGYEKINARSLERSLIPLFWVLLCMEVSKGKSLNVYVAVLEDIWFGKGQRLHRLVIT